MIASHRLASALLLVLAVGACETSPTPTPLTLEVFTAPENSYGVTSVIVYGPTEAALIDAQFRGSDTERLADRIEAIGRPLTVIFVTHPDTDHVVGLPVLHRRFPNARIYMTAAAMQVYRDTMGPVREQFARSPRPGDAPPLEPLATELPGLTLRVDGQVLEIIPDLQGDNAVAPTNSVVWIPSLRALLASDMAFQDVHVYLEDSTPEGREAWRAALQRLEAMNPAIVVAGHKRDPASADSPEVLSETQSYLEVFDRRARESANAATLEAAMLRDYPDLAYPLFLTVSSRSLYPAAE